MKPSSIDEMVKLLKEHGWVYNFSASLSKSGMYKAWPSDLTLLTFEEADRLANDAYMIKELIMLGDGQLINSSRANIRKDNWPVFRKTTVASQSQKIDHNASEGDQLMDFFFACAPSDPNKLPPPPKVLGRSWDELAGD